MRARSPVIALADPARRVAYELLRAVSRDGAYANLRLPELIAGAGLDGRDAALATELGYGAVRATGTLDAVLAACSSRALDRVDDRVREVLRLGAYQLLRTRVPPHAAVAATVDLSREVGAARASGFVNAVLRAVARRDWEGWADALARTPQQRLALRTAHPEWVVSAFADALGGDPTAALEADDARPVTHLVAYPGLVERAELPGEPGPWSPYAVRLAGGDPAAVPAVREHRAAVQDEGSQLCAIALATAPVDGRDELWLDLCAGPGGKTALLAALAAPRGARVVANEIRPHRAELVRRATARWDVEVRVGDARELSDATGGVDRVLVDAPCTGLGALRRRPEARWRRRPEDVAPLAALQRELLDAALRLVRPGGVVAYVVCSPHLAETHDVVAALDGDREVVDARPLFPDVPELGDGPTVQLWPHRHATDAMFCAIIRA